MVNNKMYLTNIHNDDRILIAEHCPTSGWLLVYKCEDIGFFLNRFFVVNEQQPSLTGNNEYKLEFVSE